jgi:hypothetical protein
MQRHWDRVLSEFIGFTLLIIVLPFLHTHLSPPHEVCDNPDQAAHYHTLGHKEGVSSLAQHLAGLGVKVDLYALGFIPTEEDLAV